MYQKKPAPTEGFGRVPTGMYCAPCGTWLWLVAGAGVPPAWLHRPCSPRGADRCRDSVGIDAHQAVISKRSDVGDAQDGVGAEVLLDREIPFLDGRRFRVRLHALRREDGAVGTGTLGPPVQEAGGCTPGVIGVMLEQTEPAKVCRAVVRRQRVQQERQVVDQRIIGAEAGANRGLAVAEQVPREADAGAEQLLRVVLRVDGIADDRDWSRSTPLASVT